MTEYESLSGLISRLGDGVERFDERFARQLAKALHEQAEHFSLPVVDELGLEDIIVTFHMDQRMQLVVTGRLPGGVGDVSIRWREEEFPLIAARLEAEPRKDPYIIATLDFSVRGAQAVLRNAVMPLAAGTRVRIRALATIGDRVEYRVESAGVSVSATPDDLEVAA